MKNLFFALTALMALKANALNPRLAPIVEKVESCLAQTQTLLCDESIYEDLKSVNMDSRGEFVYFLKDRMLKNETPAVIENLYTELQSLVTVYEELDSCLEWSCRDAKVFLGDVSVRYVKIAPIESGFLIKLYRDQRAQQGRYGLLSTLQGRASTVSAVSEMEEMVLFAEFAKDHSRTLGDEFYLYQAAVDIIKKMTEKMLALSPAHEGIYQITFDDPKVNTAIRMDRMVVIESNYRDGLVVNFSYSKSNLVRFAFKSAGILGSQIFSSNDAYNDRLDFNATYFKLSLDKVSGNVKGVFSSERFGKATFTGKRLLGVDSVYQLATSKEFELKDLIGRYDVKFNNQAMKLVLRTRADDKTLIEAALVNENALISFSKVRLDNKGILHLVDSRNERKVFLAVTLLGQVASFEGLFINAAQGSSFNISSF